MAKTTKNVQKGSHLIVVPFVSQAMKDEEEFEHKNRSADLIKWTIKDFQANLPGVRMFSLNQFLNWRASLSGHKRIADNKIFFSLADCRVVVLKEYFQENDVFK